MATNQNTTESNNLRELAARANRHGFEINHRPGHIFKYQLVGPMVTVEGLDEMIERLDAQPAVTTDAEQAEDGYGFDIDGRFLRIVDTLDDRVRWAHGMLGCLLTDSDADGLMIEALGGIDAHVMAAREILDELNTLRQEIRGGAS